MRFSFFNKKHKQLNLVFKKQIFRRDVSGTNRLNSNCKFKIANVTKKMFRSFFSLIKSCTSDVLPSQLWLEFIHLSRVEYAIRDLNLSQNLRMSYATARVAGTCDRPPVLSGTDNPLCLLLPPAIQIGEGSLVHCLAGVVTAECTELA